MDRYDGYTMHSGNGAMWVVMTVVIITVVAAVALAIWALLHSTRSERRAKPATSAEDTLADRFARGDVDETEYLQRLSTLRSSRNPNSSE